MPYLCGLWRFANAYLKIYIEGKRIFTFYDNLEFSLFENQMRKRKIPLEYKRKEK